MRGLFLACAALVAATASGCASRPATGLATGQATASGIPVARQTDCGAAALAAWVGTRPNEAQMAALRAWRGERPVRVLKPGSVATMDFRPDRLNIDIDEHGTITRVRCG